MLGENGQDVEMTEDVDVVTKLEVCFGLARHDAAGSISLQPHTKRARTWDDLLQSKDRLDLLSSEQSLDFLLVTQVGSNTCQAG